MKQIVLHPGEIFFLMYYAFPRDLPHTSISEPILVSQLLADEENDLTSYVASILTPISHSTSLEAMKEL